MLGCKSSHNVFKCIHVSHKSHFSLKKSSPVCLLCSCGVKVFLHDQSKDFIFFSGLDLYFFTFHTFWVYFLILVEYIFFQHDT